VLYLYHPTRTDPVKRGKWVLEQILNAPPPPPPPNVPELPADEKDPDKFARCFAEKMLTYALGRGLEYARPLSARHPHHQPLDRHGQPHGGQLDELWRFDGKVDRVGGLKP